MGTSGASEHSQRRRTLQDLRNLSRSQLFSKYRASLDRVGKKPSAFPPLSFFFAGGLAGLVPHLRPRCFSRQLSISSRPVCRPLRVSPAR
jgi:hypothetical protein